MALAPISRHAKTCLHVAALTTAGAADSSDRELCVMRMFVKCLVTVYKKTMDTRRRYCAGCTVAVMTACASGVAAACGEVAAAKAAGSS